ncbi:hypothetical protein B0H66DRAFT_618881 [Apodospora peruviana]|uniref:Uncharacterized protein n=1 Tax=Apodospora peruviana TaxID=516989 RepID=A0AAE0IAZ9_9PEZI|nr:hypothetical protein B0H66DRAFT_618881 [Apodospora peruviana]
MSEMIGSHLSDLEKHGVAATLLTQRSGFDRLPAEELPRYGSRSRSGARAVPGPLWSFDIPRPRLSKLQSLLQSVQSLFQADMVNSVSPAEPGNKNIKVAAVKIGPPEPQQVLKKGVGRQRQFLYEVMHASLQDPEFRSRYTHRVPSSIAWNSTPHNHMAQGHDSIQTFTCTEYLNIPEDANAPRLGSMVAVWHRIREKVFWNHRSMGLGSNAQTDLGPSGENLQIGSHPSASIASSSALALGTTDNGQANRALRAISGRESLPIEAGPSGIHSEEWCGPV